MPSPAGPKLQAGLPSDATKWSLWKGSCEAFIDGVTTTADDVATWLQTNALVAVPE
jgi:hypothetical protein